MVVQRNNTQNLVKLINTWWCYCIFVDTTPIKTCDNIHNCTFKFNIIISILRYSLSFNKGADRIWIQQLTLQYRSTSSNTLNMFPTYSLFPLNIVQYLFSNRTQIYYNNILIRILKKAVYFRIVNMMFLSLNILVFL